MSPPSCYRASSRDRILVRLVLPVLSALLTGPAAFDAVAAGRPAAAVLPLVAFLALLGVAVALDARCPWLVCLEEDSVVLHRRTGDRVLPLVAVRMLEYEYPWAVPRSDLFIETDDQRRWLGRLVDEDDFVDELLQRAPHVSVRDPQA